MSADDRAALEIAERKWRETVVKERRALKSLEGDEFVSAAISHLARFSSEKRAAKMLCVVRGKPPEVFWRIFLEVWSVCDCTWKVRDLLLHQLKNASAQMRATPFFSKADRIFFESLPPNIPIFRGCSREHINGLSWTTDAAVAKGFAYGHRGIPIPEPVLVTAKVMRRDIFAVITGRAENEVVCSPSQILRIDDVERTRRTNSAGSSNKPLC
jgi:hypothetical protein